MKILLGLLIWPWTVSLGYALGKSLRGWDFFDQHQLLIGIGFFAYLVIHVVLYRPVFAYVMAHEFTHALWAWLLGREVKEVHVARESGHVVVSEASLVVSLVPYVFPLYTMMLLGLSFIVVPAVMPYLMALIGASLGFHVCLTLYALRTSQSDLQVTGRFLGISLIVLVNLMVLTGLLALLAPSAVKIPAVAADTWGAFKAGAAWVADWLQRRQHAPSPRPTV